MSFGQTVNLDTVVAGPSGGCAFPGSQLLLDLNDE